MAYNNGKITAPVSIKDIQQALGTSETRLSQLCSYASINKYSIIKPIDYPTNGERCPDFKGYAEDNLYGKFYGVRTTVPANTVNFRDNLLSSDWSYVRRTIGGELEYPSRQLDFDGYNHNALPKLSAEIVTRESGKLHYSDEIPFTVKLYRNFTNNPDGINPCDCIPNNSGVGAWYEWHPCVMVGPYATVLINEDGGQIELGDQMSGVSIYKCPPIPEGLKGLGDWPVTFFLACLHASGNEHFMMMAYANTWELLDVYGSVDIPVVTVPGAVNINFEWVK